ncbi:hypothetical protein M2352_003477 [Azospirillum fermentarium]|uniref:hypothetical protein n=1 Tax=Azospirillum fermentarium TaxID=1233114 RepID=UPI0022268B11|nr:hypothetical protein [Azospirillum fermentarium]MCW2247843.1 hypothetical protein [Azospirillum fermentarium]
MGIILKLIATGAPVEQLAQAASWRLSELRRRVLGVEEENIEALYIVDAAGALPSLQLEDRIKEIEKFNAITDEQKHNAIEYAVKRAVIVYCGYWNIDKVRFVGKDADVGDVNAKTINHRNEIDIIMKNIEEINKEMSIEERRRQDTRRTLQEVVSPEFDRIDAQLASIKSDTKDIGDIKRDVKELLDRMRGSQGTPSP